jgi:pimeloyl-ACP methyl ester carboxylesterase
LALEKRELKTPVVCLVLSVAASLARADGLRDNNPKAVRRVPRLGIELTAKQRDALSAGLKELDRVIDDLTGEIVTHRDPKVRDRLFGFLSDVQVFSTAVAAAYEHQEFFHPREVKAAFELLGEGMTRAAQLKRGHAPWAEATGLVVRGYYSRIDGSVQPYGLVIPESFDPEGAHRHRVDIWFHGRGETLSEVNFLTQRRKKVGTFAPKDTIVLHPYGRYSNAFKFAGEVDVLEALRSVTRRYHVDEDRISVRGFSMGGAACWQFAVHYPDRWFAANPGAGFSETPEFLRFFQKETLDPTWYERKLWHLYDCTDWAANLHHLPTVAYSGELDIQKQAADIMATAMAKEGIDLVHVIGEKTKHRYDFVSEYIVGRKMDSLADVGRESDPRRVRFVTYTLRYNEMHWVRVDGLKEHWEKATVDARIVEGGIDVKTQNVTGLTLGFAPGHSPFASGSEVRVRVDGTGMPLTKPRSDRSWTMRIHRSGGKWQAGERRTDRVRKRHGLQGPIDDAFMDSFIFVSPGGTARHPKVESWTRSELARAKEHWRRQFRGDARVSTDKELNDEHIADANLVLWGDPTSNSVLAKIAKDLPIRWLEDAIVVGDRRFSTAHHALILICPNPLNPKRYVVLNSGFTYREFAYLNNARQVSKLPDWAVVDLDTAPDTLWPGKIVAAGFFDEAWKL